MAQGDQRSGRVWLAALAASLAAFALTLPLDYAFRHVLLPWMSGIAPDTGNALHLAHAALRGAIVEGCKLAALWLLLRRAIACWTALGLCYGMLAGAWDLLQWTLDWLRFPGLVGFSPWVAAILVWPVLAHGALGRLAYALARPPGRAAWGWAGATIASFLLVNAGLVAATLLPPSAHVAIADWLGPRWLVPAFALAVWIGTRAGAATARHVLATGLGVVFVLGLIGWVVWRHAGPTNPADLPATLLVVGGACFVALLFGRRVVLPWMREPGRETSQD